MAEKRVCLVGGNDKWRSMLKALLPSSTVVTNKNFPVGRVRNSDLVIINTNLIGHGVTRKATQIAFSNDIDVIYTSRNNIECTANDVLRWFSDVSCVA
jgi:hypothetical protein